ncbi:MAG TPA: DUF6799 domain-containing protein [Flavipsychrobacter sp.]|nr:DUF6799 domain-containing protein [Flavipsychrobacter sp.]
MKRFIAFLALSISISALALAQSSKEFTVVRKNGKTMMTKDGKTSEIKDQVTTANGHIFKPSGTVILNTGISIELKEGEAVDMNGKKIADQSQKSSAPGKATNK